MRHAKTFGARLAPGGSVERTVIRAARPAGPLSTAAVRWYTDPANTTCEEVSDWRADNAARVRKAHRRIALAAWLRQPTLYGTLWLARRSEAGVLTDFGLASLRVITDTGVAFIVDAWQNLVELENMRFHGTGSGGTAESQAQTALVTEFTSQLNPDNTRATGDLAEGATGNIFKTTGVNTYDATVAVTEHGLFSQAATGGGVMFDRSLFSAVNLASGDSLSTAYSCTLVAGS